MQKYLEKIFTDRLKELNFYNDDIKVFFEKPKQAQFGDVATNIAMLLSKNLKKNPFEIANKIIEPFINGYEFIEKVEVAKPGFINITLKNEFYIAGLNEIASQPDYGKSNIAKGKTALVEFVSANPTGLLHLGHGRQAAIGDTISNLLEYIGYKITREYYFNNAGRQMRKLAESVYARYMQIFDKDFQFPEDGYHGNYIKEIATKIHEQDNDKYINAGNLDYFQKYAEQFLFTEIKKTLDRMAVNFDSFYNEDSLYKNGKVDDVVNILKSKGLAFEREDALWFAANKVDESLSEKVIIKSTGEPTYRLPDIAYHREKILRGYDLIIDIFGADHIATYPDVIAGLKALDMDYSKIKVLIHQFVTLIKDGKPYKMSKRKADVVTLDDLIDEVGCDAVRYFFVMRSMGTHLEFDIGLATERSDKNPVYYLQYAHARIASILRFAMSEGIEIGKKVDLSLIKENAEINLIKQILDFHYIIESSALALEPHRLTNYLFDLANDFHKFYHDHRVVTEDKELTAARLMLCKVTKDVFASGFHVLGISAPEKM